MGNYALEMEDFFKSAQGDIDKVVRTVFQEVGVSLVNMSPVGKRELWAANKERAERGLKPLPKGYVGGRFRGNWQPSMGSPLTTQLDLIDKSGALSTQRITDFISAVQNPAKQSLYIMNNLPYAQRLEDGWSTQAPEGMVGITVTRWQNIIDAAVARVKK
jgi:hypothetical protein